MKSIRLLENNIFAGSLYTGLVDVNLTFVVDLELSGVYKARGNLFPYADQIQFESSGLWSTNISLVMTQQHHIKMNVSVDGSMTLIEYSLSRYEPQTSIISNFYFGNFLEDHLGKWYYPVAK